MENFLALRSRVSVASSQYLAERWAPTTARLFSGKSAASAVNAKRRIPLTVTKLNGHGDGVGKYVSDEGTDMQVIAPFAAPGDELQVEIWEKDIPVRDKWAGDPSRTTWPLFGQQVELSTPSNHRVQPHCSKYFGICGGCKLQHVNYTQQLKEKQEWVRELFAGRRHSPDMEIRDILGVETGEKSSEIYHYRNKMEFTCSTGRWLLDEDKPLDDGTGEVAPPRYPFTVGMFPVASVSARRAKQVHGKSKARRRRAAVWSPRILSLNECLLQASACNRLLQQLVSRCEDAGLQAYDFATHEGFLKQIVLRHGVNVEGHLEIMLGLVTTTFDGDQSELLKKIVSDLVQAHEEDLISEAGAAPRLVSIVESLDSEAQRHQRRRNDEASESTEVESMERVLYGKPNLEDTILDHRFEISFDSFFQPNSAQASVLYREIQRMVATLPEKPVVWDLFCGVGSIGICMGDHAKKVVGFELVEAAVERAKVNACLNGYSSDHMQFFCVDLAKNWDEDELLQKIVFTSCESGMATNLPDMVIVDPPRAGLHKKLVKMLRRMAPKHICYVSCNPHSQVPDLEALCAKTKPDVGEFGSYRVRHVQPVDMLPHTPHIETVAWLERCD